MPTTDARAQRLAEARFRSGDGLILATTWEQLKPSTRQYLVREAANWVAAAIDAGLMPPTRDED